MSHTTINARHYNVVCGVIRHNEKILCVKRASGGHPDTAGRWEFPGGKVEPDENPQQALVRELQEELHMDVVVKQPWLTTTHTYHDKGGVRGFVITMTAFECEPLGENFTPTEHNDARWLSPKDLLRLEWAPADVPIAELLFRHFTTLRS